MKLHELQRSPGSRHSIKRVGRGSGSGWGTTAGRGTKGQKSRSGGNVRRGFEGGQMPLFRRIPKRGFTNIHRKRFAVINLKMIEDRFESGAVITPEVLKERNLLKKLYDGVKILGEGELTKSVTIKANRFSKVAKEKIRAAGGVVEELG